MRLRYSEMLSIAILFVGVAAVLLVDSTDAVVLKVTSILAPPFLMLRKEPEGSTALQGNDRYEGYCADLIHQLAITAGFNYTIELVKDGRYGQLVDKENGTWNGMIGELIRREADVAVAPLTITSLRERVVDFSKPYMSVGISVMIKKPSIEPPSGLAILRPFTGPVWLCLLVADVAFLVVGLVMLAIARFGPAAKQQTSPAAESGDDTDRCGLANCLWYSCRTMVQQGTNTRSISGRVLSVTWWMFVVIVIVMYAANLVAMILSGNSNTLLPVQSVEELASQTKIKYGTLEGGSTREFFRSSTIPVYQRMWAAMSSAEPSVFTRSTEEGVQRVRNSNGNYAFMMESTMNDFYNQRQPCDTMKLGANLDSKGYGIATSKDSPHRDKITLAVLELTELGVLSRMYKKWWFDKGECAVVTGLSGAQKSTGFVGNFQPLDVRRMSGVFILVSLGIGAVIIIAVIEYLYATFVKNKSGSKAAEGKTTNQPDKV